MMDNVIQGNEIEMANLKNYLTIKEAAEYIGVAPATLRRWDKIKKLKSYRHPINRYRLYQKKDLEALLKKIKPK